MDEAETTARAEAEGWRLAERMLKGQHVWWWQDAFDPDDPRHPKFPRTAASGVVHGRPA